jgi:hypothetical protein
VLHWQYDLKGATAMTDPKDTDTTTTPVGEELPETELDQVTGGHIHMHTKNTPISHRIEDGLAAWAAIGVDPC